MAWNVSRTPPASGNMMTAGQGPDPSGVWRVASHVPSGVGMDTSRCGIGLSSVSVLPPMLPPRGPAVVNLTDSVKNQRPGAFAGFFPRSRPMTVLSEVLEANEAYASSFGAKSELALPPARRFGILTCMDARLDPAQYAGLSEGDAHVVRNAGGRASDDAIRSIVISYKLLGTQQWFVIHHTDCGMQFFTDDVMRGLLANSLETAALGPDGFHDVGTGPGSPEGANIDWLCIDDQRGSVRDDVENIRNHPLVPASISIYGYIYDVRTGRLVEVPDAQSVGLAA